MRVSATALGIVYGMVIGMAWYMVWFMAWIMAWHRLHVVVLIWMLLRAMTPKTSSARGHSRPFPQALMAALRVMVK